MLNTFLDGLHSLKNRVLHDFRLCFWISKISLVMFLLFCFDFWRNSQNLSTNQNKLTQLIRLKFSAFNNQHVLPSIELNLVKAKKGLLQKTSEDSHYQNGSKFKKFRFHQMKVGRPRSFKKLEMVAKSSSDLALFEILWQVLKSNFTFSKDFWQNLKLEQ